MAIALALGEKSGCWDPCDVRHTSHIDEIHHDKHSVLIVINECKKMFVLFNRVYYVLIREILCVKESCEKKRERRMCSMRDTGHPD